MKKFHEKKIFALVKRSYRTKYKSKSAPEQKNIQRMVSRFEKRSPDFNPYDYFLWKYLKSKVYNPIPQTIDQLKNNIKREIQKISKKRLRLIISAEGGHIENI